MAEECRKEVAWLRAFKPRETTFRDHVSLATGARLSSSEYYRNAHLDACQNCLVTTVRMNSNDLQALNIIY
jgi:hypothetical protein